MSIEKSTVIGFINTTFLNLQDFSKKREYPFEFNFSSTDGV